MNKRFKINRPLRKQIKALPCVVCGVLGCDPCHVATFGARGIEEEWSMIPMCRKHHTEQGDIGWIRMCAKHLGARAAFIERGWEFNTANGKTWLFNPKEAKREA